MTKWKSNHHGHCSRVLLRLLFLSLRYLPRADARNAGKVAPPPDPLQIDETFSPAMGIVLAAMVFSFLMMGFFIVYIRQCLDGEVQRGGVAISASDWGRRSSHSPAGLDLEVIEKFPTFEYSAVKGIKRGKEALECAVCLSEFADDETLRLIPKCDHVFHPACIGTWLASHPTCPVCRAFLVSDPNEISVRVSIPIPDSEATTSEAVTMTESETRGGRGEADLGVLDGCSGAIGDDKRSPGRSSSMKARIAGVFSRSHTTGHSLPQAREDRERFTLRLPEGVREQIISSTLNRTKSCAVAALPGTKSLEREPDSERLVAGHAKWRMLPAFMPGTRSAKVAAGDEEPAHERACDSAGEV